MSILRGFPCLVLLGAIAILQLSGCGPSGPKKYGVHGTVTFEKQPVKNGIIQFMPEGGSASTGGAAIVDGKYEILAEKGLLAGAYKVSISAPTGSSDDKGGAPGISVPPKETLPEKYNAKTELRVEVPKDNNEFNFDLSK